MCLSYFSLAGRKHHDQGSLQKRLLDLPVSEAESLTIMSGARQHEVGRDAHVVAESSHPMHS